MIISCKHSAISRLREACLDHEYSAYPFLLFSPRSFLLACYDSRDDHSEAMPGYDSSETRFKYTTISRTGQSETTLNDPAFPFKSPVPTCWYFTVRTLSSLPRDFERLPWLNCARFWRWKHRPVFPAFRFAIMDLIFIFSSFFSYYYRTLIRCFINIVLFHLRHWISSLLRRNARTKQPKHEVVVSYNFSSLKQREVVDSRDLPTYDPSECCTPSQNPSYWTRPSKKETRPGLRSDA